MAVTTSTPPDTQEPTAPPESESEHTRAIPTVTDDKR